jgi:hypothetical protein
MGDFTVIVIDASTALPVPMALVQMRNMDMNAYWEGYTDARGNFVAAEVLAGSYWINVIKSKYQPYSITLNAGPGGALMAGLIPEGGLPPEPPTPPVPVVTPAALVSIVGSVIVGLILVL